MALAFDTLGYAKQLRDRGIPQGQAEAHAEAARDFIMAELVTKTDLQSAIGHFDAKLDNLSLRLTVRLGVMLVAATAALAAIIKL
jgi:hypothetical protein